MRIRTKFRLSLFAFCLAIICCISDNNIIDPFDSQPKIVIKDGHIVFETARNKNITFKSGDGGRITIDGQDLTRIAELAKGVNLESDRLNSLKVTELQNSLEQMRTQFSILTNSVNQLQSLQTALNDSNNKINQILGTGSNALQTITVRRYLRKIPRIETSLNTLTQFLETNECQSNPCRNGGTCADTYKGYICNCPPNWEGVNCDTDVNECLRFVGTELGCQNGGTCRNTPGSYTCQCTPNWYGIHCTEQHDDCTSASNEALCGQGTCVNLQRTATNLRNFRCICNQGWTFTANNPACIVDVNECTERQPHCSVNPPVTCINLPGTFYCGPCPPGYTGNGYYCHDINECDVNNGGCSQSPRVQCTNTIGSRICGSCPPGYNGNGISCDFIGICRINNGGCHQSAQCFENMAISAAFRECRCPTGFIGSGVGPNGCVPQSGTTCATNPCIHGSCFPNGDSFSCVCNFGFTGSLCESEINECLSNPCLNGGTCTDQQNGYLCVCTDQWQGNTCSEPRQTCGGSIDAEVGGINFPTDPNGVYPNRMNCAWKVTTTPGKVLNVTFKSFNLEQTPDCSYDFLQIHDGPNAGSHNLGRFCGTQLPKGGNIITTHHQIYLWFKSDQSVAHDGFRLEWNTTNPVCGGELQELQYGAVNSPGYPGNYAQNRDCYWLVKVPLGKRIQFHFATLQIESHSSCDFDFLAVFDGQRDTDPLLGKFCNTTTPPPMTTSGSQSLIYFHSDGTIADHGFHITYSAMPGIPGCGGTLTTEKGSFNSPNFPDRYDNNVECDWIIRVHPLDRIQIQFSIFDLEDHSKCRFDYLEIRDGDNSEAPLINRLCGREMPRNIISTGNKVWIKFRADSSFTGQGFRAQYSTLCGGLFTDIEGVIKSPFFPDSYPSDRKCQYHIVLPRGNLVQLSFQHFDVEGSIDCSFDYLQIRESHENGSDVGKFCGTDLPETITSKYNELWLEFGTDGSVNNHGFYANYTNIEIGCGGVLTTNHGTISTPNEAVFYSNSVRCSWLIRTDPGFVIRLTFTVFAINFHRTCATDYVEVRDSNNALIGKYCGNRLPPVLTSTGNQLFVSLKSSRRSQEGFAASYSFIDSTTSCGGNYFTDSGIIRSPGYPNASYPPQRDCIWILEVTNGRQIVLNVTNFEVESGSNCKFDYLEIRNGREERSPLIGKFCGTTIPKTIVSHGHVMYLRFKTDLSLSGKGFEITYDSGTTGCGGTLTSQTGSIESPGYPEPYGHNAECVWLISVSRGSTVSLTLVDIDIEAHTTCRFDYLEIFDGSSDRSSSLGKYCNNRLTHHFIQSKSNVLFLKFKTDTSETGRGFRLNYQINCTNTVSGHRGVIESPNFPDLYNHNSNCSWRIRAPRGNNMTIAFSQLLIEPDLNCQYDYLQVMQMNYTANRLIEVSKYCGVSSQVPPPFNVTYNEAVINFVSDNSVAHIGFRLEWVAVGCGGDFINKNFGQFVSPNYPNGYPHDTECIWHIHTPPDSHIQLTIDDFDLEGDQGCTFDYLKVFLGPDDTSPLILNQCHKLQEPKIITSMGRSMTVKFSSDISFRGKGFRASFQRLSGSCSGLYTTEAAVITSPKFPSAYDFTDDCEYTIDVKGLHDIEITFEDFGMPFSVNCTESYLSIFDGPTAEDRLLLKHCGDSLPPQNPLRSTANKVYMRMKANGRTNGKGFKLSYKTMCGGTKLLNTNQLGELTSPNYPVHSPLNPNCHWILIGSQPEDRITLTFTHIDIHATDDCEHQFVEIRDGDTDSSPRIGRYCGDRLPVPITSQGNALYITNSFGIFRATYATSTSFCGGEFLAQEGYFMSPNYPNSYPLETECIWIIRSAPGNRVTFSFIFFEIETNDYCNTDYVELREQSSSGPLLGRYCGLQMPTLNFTSTNILWVKFRSDQSGTAPGFQAYYALEHGIDLTGSYGQIGSPGYPNEIRPQDTTFSWTITVPQYKYVSITFLELALNAPYGDCTSFIALLDGIGEMAPELGRYCGYNLPDPISGNTNVLTVNFVMTTEMSGKFLLNWNAINDSEWYALRNTQLITLSNTTFDINVNKSTSYVLMSPGYPSGYETYLNYNWTFHTSQTHHFKVNITDLNLEGWANAHCYYDMIKLMTPQTIGSSVWRVNKTICGRFSGLIELPAFHKMKISFLTDGSVNKTGFNLTVNTVCGGTLYGSSGVLSTEDLMSSIECDWIIRVREGRTIQLTFESINIADNNNCQYSYIMLRNGPRKTSPLLGGGKYCGRSIPIIPESSSNRLRIEFFARRDLHADFHLRYNEVSIGCGGQLEMTFTNKSLEIMSPNYPQLPPHNLECDWIIRSPSNTNIRFDFVYELNPNRCNTSSEFVEIRDGGTEVSPIINKYCVPPRYSNSIESSANYMFVRFVTSNAENPVSFKANLKINDCGGTYFVGSSLQLNLPNYPNNYTDNMDCIYFIKGYYSSIYFQINITFMDINGVSDCSSGDYVEFREESGTGDLIGRYCGSSDENSTISFSSKGSVLYIQFKSDISQTGKGLKISFIPIWSQCGATIDNAIARGVISSPKYPSAVSHWLNCNWYLFAPPGRSIKLTFLDYNLKVDPRNTSNCLDTLKVKVIQRTNANQLRLPCGATVPQPIQMQSHITSFSFRSSGLAPGEGFRIEYSADEEEVCGGLLSGSSGSISSYRFGESNFTEPIDCFWDLSIPSDSSNYTVAFVFDVFEIPSSLRCFGSFLQLVYYNFRYRYFWHFHNNYCGNLTSNSNKFEFFAPNKAYNNYGSPRLYLSTNYSNGYRGIRGKYYIQECGGYFENPEGEFNSPNYPNDYPIESYCVWIFSFQWGTKLRISFLEFNLDNDCNKDYVQISQGWWEDSPKSDKYCGSRTPLAMESSASKMTVTFKATALNSQITRKFKMSVNRIEQHGCGGHLMHPFGTIHSTNYNVSRYENNIECFWTIQVPIGYHINFTFVDRFDIESATNCDNDYILFQERLNPDDDQSVTTIGKYCGIERPPPFKSKTHRVDIIFRTNDNINSDGFRLNYQIACGEILTEPTGVIMSPNFPDNYKNMVRCQYLILRDSRDNIILEFDEIDVERHDTCRWDAVDIYLGNDTSAQHQGPYCGTEKPPIISSEGALLITFKSDSSVNSKGFKASYKISACGGNLTDPSGQITNPISYGQPTTSYSYYDWHYRECIWYISVRENRAIEMKFSLMNIQYCYYESVDIRDGDNSSAPFIGRFCSAYRDAGAVVKSSGNTIWVRFRTFSERRHQTPVFRLGYRTTLGEAQGCGGVFNNNTQGFIESPDIDNDGNYELDLNCWYHLIMPEDKVIKITFLKMDIEESPSNTTKCSYDFIEIRDGISHKASLIDRYCGTTIPSTIIGSSNKLVLQFFSDSTGVRTGFKAKFEAIDKICGGFLNVTNVTQTVQSVNYPNSYPTSLRCKWYFQLDRSEYRFWYLNIRLKFIDLDVNCANQDHIEFNADSYSETRIAPYIMCGNNPPPTISSRNGLWMTFVSNSNPALNHRGFKLNYTYSECNQSYTEDSGILVNPQYPDYYYTSFCVMNITAKVGHTISLYFNDFNFGCPYRNMSVRDGLDSSAPTLAVLCGTILPDPIFSNGNKLSILVNASNWYYSKFFISYSTTNAGRGCGGNLTSFNGTFTSPLYPQPYNESRECKWFVHSFGLHTLTLRFTQLSLSSTIGCQSNYVEVYEGITDLPTNRVIRICGDDNPSPYQSRGNVLLIKLVTNENNTGPGFRAQYNFNSQEINATKAIMTSNLRPHITYDGSVYFPSDGIMFRRNN